jgi:hypothetical protein
MEKEMKEHPIGTINSPLPLERLNLRKQFSKETFENVKSSEWWNSRPEKVKEAFERCPPYKFYVTSSGSIIRVYGIIEGEEIRYHIVSAHIGFVNDVIGGMEGKDLIEVENWKDEHIFRIGICGCPSVFFDPCGWMMYST